MQNKTSRNNNNNSVTPMKGRISEASITDRQNLFDSIKSKDRFEIIEENSMTNTLDTSN